MDTPLNQELKREGWETHEKVSIGTESTKALEESQANKQIYHGLTEGTGT